MEFTTTATRGACRSGTQERCGHADGRLTLRDGYGNEIDVHGLRTKAHDGWSKRDGRYWLAQVTVTSAAGDGCRGWLLFVSGDGGMMWRVAVGGHDLRELVRDECRDPRAKALATTLDDALHLAWLRVYRAHPAGRERARVEAEKHEVPWMVAPIKSRRRYAQQMRARCRHAH